MPAKKTRVAIIVAALAIVIFGCLAYIRSDHHKYGLALKHFRNKEYQQTIQALNRLTPKGQSSIKASYLRGFCLYHFANLAYESQQYDASLQTLATIPETYVGYEDVEKLRSTIQLKKTEIADAERRNNERQQEIKRQTEEEEKKRAERLAQENVQALEQETKRIKPLYDTGLLTKFNIDANEAWVNPSIWDNLEYDAKAGVAAALAKICDLSASSGRISIINNKT